MPLFISTRKLNAAVGSLHQMMPAVRSIFPHPPDDDVVEAATVFLYRCVATRVFGHRFARALMPGLRRQYRHSPSVDIERRAARIAEHASIMGQAEDQAVVTRSDSRGYADNVTSAIRALFTEAEMPDDQHELVSNAFARFEAAVEKIRQHLEGIKRQNIWVMRGS